MDYQKIKEMLEDASVENKKTAMFHYIFFKYADDFIDESPEEICRLIGAKVTMAQEIRKMRAMHLLIKEKGLPI